MSHMPCCGARLTPEGYHAPDCEDVAAAQEEYEAMLAEEHRREERLQYEREDQRNDRTREWVEETYPGDVRNIPGGY